MSNISRRKFLKGAGAAALAVAAAGVLAGCSGNNVPGTDVPDTPVTSMPLTVYFTDTDKKNYGNGVGSVYETSVLKDAKKYDPTLIPADKLPEGYELANTGLVDILDNGNTTFAKVPVQKKASQPASQTRVKITLQFTTGGQAAREVTVDVDRLFDLASNPYEMVEIADVKEKVLAVYDDIEIVDTTWRSYLTKESGYYNATVPLTVALKN